MVADTALDLIGHVCYAHIFAGQVLLAKKNRLGWAVRLAGELGWAAIGITMGMSSIWFWCFLFAGLDIYGWRRWSERDPNGNNASDA